MDNGAAVGLLFGSRQELGVTPVGWQLDTANVSVTPPGSFLTMLNAQLNVASSNGSIVRVQVRCGGEAVNCDRGGVRMNFCGTGVSRRTTRTKATSSLCALSSTRCLQRARVWSRSRSASTEVGSTLHVVTHATPLS